MKIAMPYQDGVLLEHFGRAKEFIIYNVSDLDPVTSEVIAPEDLSHATVARALKEHGVLVNQHESPFYRGDALACQRAHRNIVHSFELSRLFQAHIPTYPSGHWLFGFSSRGVHPVRDLNPDWWNSLGLETKYYNTNLHKGAFYLPNYVQKLLEKVEE